MAQHDEAFSDYYKSMADLGYSQLEAANKLAAQYDIEPIEPLEGLDETESFLGKDHNWNDGSSPVVYGDQPVVEPIADNSTNLPDNWFTNLGPGGLMDTVAQHYVPAFGIMRNLDAMTDETKRPGTLFGIWDKVSNWYDTEDPLGLLGTTENSGLFDEAPWDEGSYTSVPGGYSYGTIDGIGVEDPN